MASCAAKSILLSEDTQSTASREDAQYAERNGLLRVLKNRLRLFFKFSCNVIIFSLNMDILLGNKIPTMKYCLLALNQISCGLLYRTVIIILFQTKALF